MSVKIINVSDCLNYDSSKNANRSYLQIYKDELYCIWEEENTNNSRYQIKMKKYNGKNSTNISNNLNYDSNKNARNPSMETYKNELYCIWGEQNESNWQIKMKKYDGNSWRSVSSCLNYDKSRYANEPIMQVYKDELYCAWEENDSSNQQIKMKKYNGNSWTNVSNSLNYDATKIARNPYLKVYKDELYCAWSESDNYRDQIKIKKYNGNNWINVSNSLNYDRSKLAFYPVMKVYNNELYCVWCEVWHPIWIIKIKKYDGNSWTSVSSNLNYNENSSANCPNMKVYKDELYCIWQERNDSNQQIKIKKYNGNNWTNVFSNLNYDESKDAGYSNMQVYKDELYCAWCERNDSNYQIKMKKYTLLVEKIQKYLIKHNNKYFKINDYKEIIEVENNNFKTNGFNNINIITRELLESKFDNLKNIQILMWTDDIEKNEATMTCELRNPYRPIDVLKKNNNGICNILFKEL